MINIHPSLIPAFCGTGFYGLKVHEKALERGVKVVGATVHFVDEGTDTGPIILQKAVEVEQEDTPEVLQRRVMEQAEWQIMGVPPHTVSDMSKFESPDPGYWCRHGYAIANVDPRGIGHSEGDFVQFGTQDGKTDMTLSNGSPAGLV